MKVHFHISRQIKPNEIKPDARYLTWVGEIDWPSLPHDGSTSWVHCGGWAVEKIKYVYFNGPFVEGMNEKDRPDAPVTIEVETTEDVLDHLVEYHGFQDIRY